MQATEVKFTRRFKVGEYEHEEYGVTAQLEEGETAADALVEAKTAVISAFTAEAKEEKTETKPAGKPAKPPAKGKGKKNAPSTDSSDDEDADSEDSEQEDGSDAVESDSDDEAADNDSDDNSDDSSDDSGEDSSDSDEEQEDAPPAKPAKGKGDGKKGFKAKPQAYNRSIEQHKEIFSGVLKSVNPDWKKSEASKLKAKQVSQKMEGKDFLNKEGEVLPEFTAEVKKLMKK